MPYIISFFKNRHPTPQSIIIQYMYQMLVYIKLFEKTYIGIMKTCYTDT